MRTVSIAKGMGLMPFIIFFIAFSGSGQAVYTNNASTHDFKVSVFDAGVWSPYVLAEGETYTVLKANAISDLVRLNIRIQTDEGFAFVHLFKEVRLARRNVILQINQEGDQLSLEIWQAPPCCSESNVFGNADCVDLLVLKQSVRKSMATEPQIAKGK